MLPTELEGPLCMMWKFCVFSKRFAHNEEIQALYMEMESQISAEKERIRAEVSMPDVQQKEDMSFFLPMSSDWWSLARKAKLSSFLLLSSTDLNFGLLQGWQTYDTYSQVAQETTVRGTCRVMIMRKREIIHPSKSLNYPNTL